MPGGGFGLQRQEQAQNARWAFAIGVAKLTGLSPKVVYTWTLAENTDQSVVRRPGNYLNLELPLGRNTSYSGVPVRNIDISSDGGRIPGFKNLAQGITETAYWINKMPNFAGIKASAGKSEAQQIQAIESSHWAGSQYHGNGLMNLFLSQGNLKVPPSGKGTSIGSILAYPFVTTYNETVGAAQGAGNAVKKLNPLTYLSDTLNTLVKDAVDALAIVGSVLLFLLALLLIGADIGIGELNKHGAVKSVRSKTPVGRLSQRRSSANTERRAEERHRSQLQVNKARRVKLMSDAKYRKRTREEQEKAENKKYYEGARDATV